MGLNILWFVVSLIIWCIIVAKLEIHTEGVAGWAKNLPTYRYRVEGKIFRKKPFNQNDWIIIDHPKWWEVFIRWYSKNLLGNKDWTGYHRWLDAVQLFVGMFVISHFFTPQSWWQAALRVIAFIYLSWSIEDTFWFILNPAYGLKKYKPEFIPWHADRWFIFCSRDMLVLFLEGAFFFVLSFVLSSIF